MEKKMKKRNKRSHIMARNYEDFKKSFQDYPDYENLEFVPEGLKITISKSKTDQFGEGMIKALPYFSNEIY